jgi:hypothetical protein
MLVAGCGESDAGGRGDVPARPVARAPLPFAVLRAPRRPRDTLRADLRQTLAVKTFHVRIFEARRLRLPASLPATWIVPGPTGLCLVQPLPRDLGEFGGACVTNEQARRGLLFVRNVVPAGRPASVVGVVPDGIRSVIVRGVNAARLEVAVNAYGGRVRRPRAVEFKRGRRRTSVPLV